MSKLLGDFSFFEDDTDRVVYCGSFKVFVGFMVV